MGFFAEYHRLFRNAIAILSFGSAAASVAAIVHYSSSFLFWQNDRIHQEKDRTHDLSNAAHDDPHRRNARMVLGTITTNSMISFGTPDPYSQRRINSFLSSSSSLPPPPFYSPATSQSTNTICEGQLPISTTKTKSRLSTINGDIHPKDGDDDNKIDDLHSLLSSHETTAPYDYERMDVPNRVNSETHAIHGQLLKQDLVESYHVYKRLRNNNDETTATTDPTDLSSSLSPPPHDPNQNLEIVAAVVRIGASLDGHEGVVHGGILALLIDDVLGFGYEALGDVPMAVTANLNINYMAPVPANTTILVLADLLRREGRKLYWEVRVVSTDRKTLYCNATSLFIIPRSVFSDN